MQSYRILMPGSNAQRIARTPRALRSLLTSTTVLLALAGCGDAGGTGTSAPPSATPGQIRLDQASVRLDEGNTARLRVLITESDGRTHELSGSNVAWSVRDPDVATVSAGLVRGLRAGVTEVVATVGGTRTAKAEIHVLTVPGSVEVLRGDRQVGIVGEPLLSPVRFHVQDRSGRPLEGVELRVSPLGPGGSVTPANPRTDADGFAEVVWTLGTRAGPQAADVTIADREGVVRVATAMAVPGAVARIEVTPSDALVTPGGHVRYVAAAVDKFGNLVPDAVLQWGLQDSTVATITADGVVRATREGETAVEARYVAPTLAGLSAQGPPDTKGWGRFKAKRDADVPEQVGDLRSPSQTTTAVTLSFTQVGDGTGDPADYEVRYAPTPIGAGFPGAHIVRQGSCQSPVIGTAIGARMTCVVEGLDAGVSYDFQMVAFRGTMGIDAVVGPVSNAVTATTSSSFPAAVEIAGGNNQTGTVGSLLAGPLVVRVKNSVGAAMAGFTVDWRVETGGGSVTALQSTTNSLGLAEVGWKLGASAGPNTARAAVGSLSALFAANATAPTAGPATVTVTPGEKTIQKGQTYQLTAEARDAQGKVLPGVLFNWSTSDATRATVSSGGMVYGIDAGNATIRASATGVEGASAITVEAPGAGEGRPANVTTLAVASTTSHSATLRFTEVNDGTGKPADYTVRYHISPIGWNWGAATRVIEGTCAQLKGIAIGNERTCVVEGLQAGTKYDFQMIAHRTDANGNLVFSENLSNPATGTTLAPTNGALTISPDAVTLQNLGATRQLSVSAKAADGSPISNPGVVWSSANPNIASIDSNGMLTARGIGTVVITAAAACCASDQITVSVEQFASSLTVDPTSASITKGQSTRLSATVRDGNGKVVTNAPVTWESYNASVAAVAADGTVTGMNTGSTSVVAKSGTLSAAAPVSVTATSGTPASVSVSPVTLALSPGQTVKVTATVKDASGSTLTNATVTWESYSASIASVSSDGTVTGVAGGSTSVIARAGSISAAVPVTVSGGSSGTSSISVSPTSLSLSNGQSSRIIATVRDANGNTVQNATVTWESQNSGIASVASDGTVTGQNAGSTSVVARSGSLSAAVPVTVSGGSSGTPSITVSPTSLSISGGQSSRIVATVRDANGNVQNATVTWESQNTSVATVASDGTVTGQNGGSTSVIARSGTLSSAVPVYVQSDDQPPSSQGWPNEPSGVTVAIDEAFTNKNIPESPAGRWVYGGNWFSNDVSLQTGGPASGSSAMRWTWPAGRYGGDSPGRAVVEDTRMSFSNALYIGVWVRWSLPWTNHESGVNKILYWGELQAREYGYPPAQFMLNRRGRYIDAVMQWGQNHDGMCIRDPQRNVPNHCDPPRLASTSVDDGRWHLIEMRADGSTNGLPNGRLRVWVDGILQFDIGDIRYAPTGSPRFYGIDLDPVWGGVGGTKPQVEWLEFDHLRMSGR